MVELPPIEPRYLPLPKYDAAVLDGFIPRGTYVAARSQALLDMRDTDSGRTYAGGNDLTSVRLVGDWYAESGIAHDIDALARYLHDTGAPADPARVKAKIIQSRDSGFGDWVWCRVRKNNDAFVEYFCARLNEAAPVSSRGNRVRVDPVRETARAGLGENPNRLALWISKQDGFARYLGLSADDESALVNYVIDALAAKGCRVR